MGIGSVFGLPGDFNLEWLDSLYGVDGLSWAGSANELNAAYSADGYARTKGVPGCIVTTHGVGELGAISGIAGAAAEHVPIIHVVGQTPRLAQKQHMQLHHNVGRYPDHQMYNKMSSPLRAASADLWDIKTAPADIDRVIRECLVTRLPVYIHFPIDMAYEQVPASLLEEKIDLSLPVNAGQEEAALAKVMSGLYAAKNPSVFVDHLVHSYGFREARALCDQLALPTYSAHMAKAVIDEDKPYYVGLFNGAVTEDGSERLHESDLVLCLGWWETDSNSAGFSRRIPVEQRIDVLEDHVIVCGQPFPGVYMAPFLRKLRDNVDISRITRKKVPRAPRRNIPKDDNGIQITHRYLWRQFSNYLKEGDVVLADTGTAALGILDSDFPKNTLYISQTYYGSIGYANASAFGVETALKEIHDADPSKPRRRTILLTGDGSMQLTIQEVGTMIARGLQPIILIVNNNGYTVEKAIHGARQAYNNISVYNWSAMLSLFGAKNPEQQFRSCKTKKEFEAAWSDAALNDPREAQVIEVVTDPKDLPWRLGEGLASRSGQREYLDREGFHWRG